MPVTILLEIASGAAPGIVEEDNRIATFYPDSWSLNAEKEIVLSGTVVATVFGAIHCIAWHFTFPSNTERYIWRIASVAITSLPFSFLFLCIIHVQWPTNIFPRFLVSLLYVYAICRISLLILPFLSLRALRPGVYRTLEWVTLIPHL
jgi:hypothetical protein